MVSELELVEDEVRGVLGGVSKLRLQILHENRFLFFCLAHRVLLRATRRPNIVRQDFWRKERACYR